MGSSSLLELRVSSTSPSWPDIQGTPSCSEGNSWAALKQRVPLILCNLRFSSHLPNAAPMSCRSSVLPGRRKRAPFSMDEDQMGRTHVAGPESDASMAAENDLGSRDMGEIGVRADHEMQAQRGLAMALSQAGLSEQDSVSVASKAPFTVQSLIDAALELDEFAAWIAQQPSVQQDLEQRVFELVIDNPSRQFAALVESIGVEERRISRMCHFLISQNIADVWQKIRFLEDAFPNEKDESIAIRIRRMMREMSLSADIGLQRTLSFFEKMEAKRGGIGVLNIPRDAMPHIIEEFPEILVRDFDPGFKDLSNYFEEIGVPKESVTSVIMCYPSILLYSSVKDLKRRLQTLRKGASIGPRNFGKMVVKYPWILSRCVGSNGQQLTEFLKTVKVPLGMAGSCIVKCPNLLGCSTMTMQTIVVHMMVTGIKTEELGRVFTHYPQLLLKKPRDFDEIVNFLKSWGLDKIDMVKLLMRCPPIFASNVTYLWKKITLLQQLGIRKERLEHVLRRYPEYLMLSLENSLQPRIRFLRSTGLSNEDIAFMICGFPPLLGYSIDLVLKPKLDVLENVLCHSIKEVVAYPRYFSYGLERRIIPRFRILKRANVKWDLKSMLSPSNDQFAHDYLGVGRMIVPPV